MKRTNKNVSNNRDIDDILAEEFDQDRWNNIYSYFSDEFKKLDEQLIKKAENINIPNDIKQVLICKLGIGLDEWINSSIPAFAGKRPVDYLKDEEGIKILKAGIMRMPD